MGYTFPGTDTEGQFPCPPSFAGAGDGGAVWFCTLAKGAPGFTDFPPGAKSDCSDIATGVFGFSWPR